MMQEGGEEKKKKLDNDETQGKVQLLLFWWPRHKWKPNLHKKVLSDFITLDTDILQQEEL